MSELSVPELGPSLGRLCLPSEALPAAGPRDVPLHDLRLRLVGELFELAGAAREFLAAGDRAGALQSLGRSAWLGVWDRTLDTAAERLAASVNARLRSAGAESRLPVRRLEQVLVTAEETQAIAARLGSGGAAFVAALDDLERTLPRALPRTQPRPQPRTLPRAASRDGSARGWEEALLAAARRLETAWDGVERAAAEEEARWNAEIARVRAWRRPRWPLWLVTGVVLAIALALGLVLGGYLPVPEPLEGLASWWWDHL